MEDEKDERRIHQQLKEINDEFAKEKAAKEAKLLAQQQAELEA